MMRNNHKIAAVFLAVLLLAAVGPLAWAAPQIPAKPDRFDYVYDLGGLLTPQDKEVISSVGRELDDKTKAQVIVVTVDSLGDAAIEDYSNALFRSWGIGDKAKNNGVLLLVNKENLLTGKPGRVRMEVGYGLEGAIPDSKAGRILDSYVLPRWEQKKYSEGILQGYLAAAAEVAKEYQVTLSGSYQPVPVKQSPQSQSAPAPLVGLIVMLVLGSLFFSAARRRKKKNRWDDDDFGGGGFFGGGGGFFGGGGGFGGGFGGGSSGGGGASR